MTYEQADELLHKNDWAKWSDARELLLIAAGLGAAAERERCARIVEDMVRAVDGADALEAIRGA